MLAGSLPLLERESDKIFIFEKTQYKPCPLFEGENRNNQVTGVDDKQTENFREKLAQEQINTNKLNMNRPTFYVKKYES